MNEEYTTTAILKASVGQYVAAFKEAKGVYQDFNRTMSSSSMSSTSAVQGSSKIVSKAMKVSAVATAGLAVAAIKTGADFEHQMSRVGAIAGANGKELKSMNDQAIKLGADTAFSAKEAAEGMENLASAGMKPQQIMQAMPGVLNLAAVSGGNVAESAENAATALNGFGLAASDSGHVADVFARAAADTNAEASDMGEALKMVAPQAHSAGLSLEETSAAIGVLSDAGLKGSMAGSNLGMALTKLQNPSKEANEAMQTLGFSAYDSNGKMKPLANQISELKGKLSGMTDKEKQFYMSQIYGVQGGRAMNIMMDAQSGKLEKLTNSLKNSDGAAAEMAKKMQNDLKSSVEQFFGSLESLAIVLEETFGGVLKSSIDGVTDSIGNFTQYLQKNQDHIQKVTKEVLSAASGMMKFLPSIQQVTSALKVALPVFIALETFKGIGAGGAKTLSMLETIQSDLSLVQRGLIMTGTASQAMGKLTIGTFTQMGSVIKNTTVKTNSFFNSLSSEKALAVLTGKFKNLGSAISGIPGKAKTMGSSLTNAVKKPDVAFSGLNNKIYSFLQTIGASDSTIAQLTNTAMKNGSAVGKIGLAGEGASEGMLQGAIGAGGFGASLGALLPIALAVAAVAAAIGVAWKTNIFGIKDFVTTAFGEIGKIFGSIGNTIGKVGSSLSPITNILKTILGVIGALALGAIVVSLIGIATALRINVDVLAAIVQAAMAGGEAIHGMIQKMIPGGSDGSESFNKAKKSIDGATSSVKDIGSAFGDAKEAIVNSANAAMDSGKKTKKSYDEVKVSVKDVGKAAKQMKTDFEDSKTKLSDLINNEGVSEKTKQFLTDVNSTLDQYQSNTKKASDNYNKMMKAADKKNGQDKLNAVNEANAKLADATQKNGKDLINVSSDLDRQLKDKRFSDGTAMTADQVNVLSDQNNKIKEKLIEQNQIFVKAQLSRVQNGEKLNKTQQQAIVTTLQSNYALEEQQVNVGEQKIKALKDKIAQDKDQTTKATDQQELVGLQAHQNQLVQSQQNFGNQMNMAISNGGKLNYQTWLQGLQNMKNVTAPELQSMFLSFVQMNNNTGQQMQAFATMLQQTGVQGVGGLVKALQDGTLTAGEASKVIDKNTIAGLVTLPNEMFAGGNKGKNSFINALKQGDFKAAGKYLAEQSANGSKDTSGHKKAGKENGKSHSEGTKSTKKDNETAGKEIGKAGVNGTKSEKNSFKSSGKSNGKSYSNGVKSETSSARSAGKSLANAAKDGAKGVSFKSIGSQMAAGIASGIRSNTDSAVSAMKSLVSQVNSESKKKADIHSPSRLLRDEVGKYLSLGVAQGIKDNAFEATNQMSSLIDNVVNTADIKPLNFSFDGSAVMTNSIDVQSFKSGIESTNQLLKRLLDKNQSIILDTGELVGATTTKYDHAFGDNIQNQERWER